MRATLTQSRLRELLTYDPATGVFVRTTNRGSRPAGSIAGFAVRGYRRLRVDDQLYFAHRLAWLYMTGEWPAQQIDHINRDRGDNRWVNLRLASISQNQANSLRHRASGLKGAYYRGGRFDAQIKKDGRKFSLGRFDTAEQAHDAYVTAAKALFGDFARVE